MTDSIESTTPTGRHPSTQHMVQMLRPNPNLGGKPKLIAKDFSNMANYLLDMLPEDNPEVTAGLRKLLEAKDCFIRAAVFGETVDYRDR